MYHVKFNAVKNLNGNDLMFDLITFCPWSSLITVFFFFLNKKIKILIKTQKSNLSVNIVFKICNRIFLKNKKSAKYSIIIVHKVYTKAWQRKQKGDGGIITWLKRGYSLWKPKAKEKPKNECPW